MTLEYLPSCGFSIVLAVTLLASDPIVTTKAVKAQSVENFYDRTDAFLVEHITDGLVGYAAIKENPAGLNALLEDIAGMNRSLLSPADDQAFLVNAYNMLVIRNVVDHYPIDSPLDVDGFFAEGSFEVAGGSYTLDELEKKELFGNYPDARFHFALVCAAIGCPSLADAAYRGEMLEKQLIAQTKQALNSPKHVRLESDHATVYVSELFSWYEKDFTRSTTTILEFINEFRESPLPEAAPIDYIAYDWRLNDANERP